MQRDFFRYGVAAFITIATIAGRSAGRDLRPSEHGLAYEESAPPSTHNNGTKEMLSFFGSKTTPAVPLPEADKIGGDTWWSVDGGGESRDVRRDHVRKVLLVVSAVCGSAGVVLLVVSGIVLLVRRRRQRAEAERLSSKPEFRAGNDD